MNENPDNGGAIVLKTHPLQYLKNIASMFPATGLIVSGLDFYLTKHTQDSINLAFQYLDARIQFYGNRIDEDFVKNAEFVELFKSCYLSILRTHQREKLNAAASLIANMLLKEGDEEKLTYTQLDHFSRCIDFLSIGAIKTLIHAYHMAEKSDGRNRSSYGSRVDFGRLHAAMPETEPALLMGLASELNAMNLFHMGGMQGVRVPDYGNHPIELTPLGSCFVKDFLMDSGVE
jgi:hypothetical protein